MLKNHQVIIGRLMKGEAITVVTLLNGAKQYSIGNDLVDGRAVRKTMKLGEEKPETVVSYTIDGSNGGFKVMKQCGSNDVTVHYEKEPDREMVKDYELVKKLLASGLPIISTKAGKRVVYEIGPHLIDGRLLRNYIGDEPFVNGVRTTYVTNVPPVRQPLKRKTHGRGSAWESFKKRRRAEIELWRKSRK